MSGPISRWTALLPLVALALGGCVVSHTVWPQGPTRSDSHPHSAGAMSVGVRALFSPQISANEQQVEEVRTREAIVRVLRNAGWSVTERSSAESGGIPSQGVACDVVVTLFRWGQIFYLAGATFALLPEYEEWETAALTYRLYLDGKLVRSYEYRVVGHIWIWLPLVVLIWANALVPDEIAEISEATRQFLYDAEPQLVGEVGKS